MSFCFRMLALAAGLAALPGCRDDDRVVVPNRVLDRPLDVVLGCVLRTADDQAQMVSLNACADAASTDCNAVDTYQLIGFVANSERNELAMFRRCDVNGLVDLDKESPGYQFLPVLGQMPSRVVATEQACRVVTANVGSCDLTVVDGQQLASYAVNLVPDTPPSSLVSRVIPRLSGGEPLGARPRDMVAVPAGLSLAGETTEIPGTDGGETGTDGGGTDTGGGGGGFDDGGDDGGASGFCAGERPASVYVTFPACQLVAEVDLQTQRILQSRQIVTNDDGSLEIVDSGPDPDCPVECPGQFDGDVPARGLPDSDGFEPVTLALVEVPDPMQLEHLGEHSGEAVDYAALFVGGAGSDTIIEIPLDTQGWAPPEETNTLLLENPAGVQVLRATPQIEVPPASGDVHQFLYAVAGDGTTHVVDRDFREQDRLGVECDTQVDPTEFEPAACHAIDPNSLGTISGRRPFAIGPGIRTETGATINDWAFQIVPPEDEEDEALSPFSSAAENTGEYRLVGIGVTSFGSIVYSNFGQFANRSTFEVPGPPGLHNIEIDVHALWPDRDPFTGNLEAMPLVGNNEPRRTLSADEQPTQVLAPALRRIDLAYARADDVSDEQDMIAEALGNVDNADGLGSFQGTDENTPYDTGVARVVARDYRQWQSASWGLIWEGEIPGASGTTGRIECDNPGWEGGTCVNLEPDDVRLVDESQSFCDDGVLPGDKLVIRGCIDDDDCGDLGQRCLREPSAPGNAEGICVSARAFEEEAEKLRQVCAPFISDPCGFPRREYIVTRAFQDELWLQAMDIPTYSYLEEVPGTDGDPTIFEHNDRLTCQLPLAARQPATACDDDQQCIDANDGNEAVVCVRGWCRGSCEGGLPECSECASDSDCDAIGPFVHADGEETPYTCIEGRCRTPCSGGSPECLLNPLPGPSCFSELVRYSTRVRNTFVVAGLSNNAPSFISERVVARPVTDPRPGRAEAFECGIDESVSTLLTSRIWLGENEEETFEDSPRAIPPCPNNNEALPGDPNPCRIVTSRFTGPEPPLYHHFSYEGPEVTAEQAFEVAAIRFSNPTISIVLDLVSLLDLASEPDDLPVEFWPPEAFSGFQRSRIPRGYREEFATVDGYVTINGQAAVQGVSTTYPVRVVNGPTDEYVFVVDAGGSGGATGVRGQIVRVNAGGAGLQDNLADQNFRVR